MVRNPGIREFHPPDRLDDMLYIEDFNKIDHMEVLVSFLRERNVYVPQEDEMPALGWVVSDLEKPIAMAFLRRVEGGYAQLDGLVTDRWAPALLRDKAIDLVVAKVFDIARQLEIKGIMAYSKDKNTLSRSQKFGFVSAPDTVIFADLMPNKATSLKESS